MFSTTIDSSFSASLSRQDENKFEGSSNPWFFYFQADKAKAKGKDNNKYNFVIPKKQIETVWAENMGPSTEVLAGFKVELEEFANSLLASAKDIEPITLFNTHNYDWTLYTGDFEIKKIKLSDKNLKIKTKAVLTPEESDLSLGAGESIQLPNASFTFPVFDVDNSYFPDLHADYENKVAEIDPLTGASAFIGPITPNHECVKLVCDSCYSDDYEWENYTDRASEITDDNIRTSSCSLGRTFDEEMPIGQPQEILRGAINSLIKGYLNCDCPCGCSVPAYCD